MVDSRRAEAIRANCRSGLVQVNDGTVKGVHRCAYAMRCDGFASAFIHGLGAGDKALDVQDYTQWTRRMNVHNRIV